MMSRIPSSFVLFRVFAAGLLAFVPLVCRANAAELGDHLKAATRPEASTSAIPHAAIFRILNGNGREYSIGTGTLVARDDRYGIVLTCGHIFDEKVQDVSVISPDGVQYAAEVCAIEKENDLSLIWIARPNVAPVPIVPRMPSLGQALTTIGYGGDGTLLPNFGKVVSFAMLNKNASSDIIEITGVARQGDSGGPMLNRAGQLTGVIIGTDGKTVDAMGCERASELLAKQSGRKPSNPAKLTRQRVEYPWIVRQSSEQLRAFGTPVRDDDIEETKEIPLVELAGRLTINGRGVSKAKIELAGFTQAGTTTDDDGRFRFPAVRAGVYSVRAEGIALNKIRSVERQVSVASDRKSNNVQLKFE